MASALVLQLVPLEVVALVLEVYPHAFLPRALPVILQVKNRIQCLVCVEGSFLLPARLVVYEVLQRLRALARIAVQEICFKQVLFLFEVSASEVLVFEVLL